MYDRRIDGKTATFGNASSLFMSAMTWWDHDTESIWSQPWGRAIEGELKGVTLFVLPSQLTTWHNWRTTHPNTLVMTNDINLMPNLRQTFEPGFVIGISIGEEARAYSFETAVQHTFIHDQIGSTPILIYAEENQYFVYVRQIEGEFLTFEERDGQFFDTQTGSEWNLERGLAIDGSYRGQTLQSLPSMTAFLDHWLDFYPNGTLWEK